MNVELTLDAPGQRLDQALAAALPDLSRTQIQRLLKEGHILLAGRPARASTRLEGGERVSIDLPPPLDTALVPEAIPLTVVYEDEDFLAVDKAAGMVVHPAPGHERGTLVNAILAHCPDLPGVGGERRPGIVHRLDKDTSGLILVAKHDAALRHLQNQFRRRTVTKRYVALVDGVPEPARALIDAPIGRDPRQRKRMAVIPPGGRARARPARTLYEVVTQFDDFARLNCWPQTGRTHQIRVHLAHIGHPLAGDAVYGRRRALPGLKRHFLHAAGLTLRRPADDSSLELTSPLPADLQRVLDQLAAG